MAVEEATVEEAKVWLTNIEFIATNVSEDGVHYLEELLHVHGLGALRVNLGGVGEAGRDLRQE
jgi:hypothetical protein